MVNKANVLRVADAIENAKLAKRDIGFNMAYVAERRGVYVSDKTGHNCGTVACIAGYSYAIKHPRKSAAGIIALEDRRVALEDDTIIVEAREFLGLPREDANALFFPDDENPDLRLDSLTVEQAVAVLRHLAETGEVDWSVKPVKVAKQTMRSV